MTREACSRPLTSLSRALALAVAILAGSCAAARDPGAADRRASVCGSVGDDAESERCLDEAFDLRTTNPDAAIARFAEVCERGVTDACAEAVRLALERSEVATTIRSRAAVWCSRSNASSGPDEALGRTCALAARSYAETSPTDLARAIELWRHACHVHAAIDACLLLSRVFGEATDLAPALTAHDRLETQHRRSAHAWQVANDRAEQLRHPPAGTSHVPPGLARDWWRVFLRLGVDATPVRGEARPPTTVTAAEAHAPLSSTDIDAPTCDSCASRCEPVATRCRTGAGGVCGLAAACVCACEEAAGHCGLPAWAIHTCIAVNAPTNE